MKKILIIGGTGFVGSNLADFFKDRYEVIIASRNMRAGSRLEWRYLDITQPTVVLELISELAPIAVIHAAGIKDVPFCEKNPHCAFRVNGIGTGHIASACHISGSKLIYISTDLVFPATNGWYREIDIPCPSLKYGQSKLFGEYRAMRELDNLVICRSGGIYGENSPLLRWLAVELALGKNVECFIDVHNTPTYADNLGEMIEDIIKNNHTGIYHMAGSERLNRFDFFSLFATEFNLDRSLLKPVAGDKKLIGMHLMPDSSLSTALTQQILKIKGISPNIGFKLLRDKIGINDYHSPNPD